MDIFLSFTLPCLFGCMVCNLLYHCFELTGSAGISRLYHDDRGFEIENLKHRLSPWEARWPRLTAALLALTVACQLAASISLGIGIMRDEMTVHHTAAVIAIYLATYFISIKLIPRAIANAFADRISVGTLPLLSLLYWPITILTAPAWLLQSAVAKILKAQQHPAARPSAEDEILQMVEHSRDRDLEEGEREMIKSALEFGDTVVREIMTPRIDLNGLEGSLSIAEAVEEVHSSPHSRFPIYEKKMDQIIGMIHVKDLLRAFAMNPDQLIRGFANPASFVPEQMPIDDLLRKLQQEKLQSAIVVDEYGGTAGLVTVEDVIEELVGEIVDEYDEEEPPIQEQADGTWLIDARTSVDEVNEELESSLPEKEEYDSIGGLILHLLGRIPEPGEIIDIGDCTVTVRESSPRQVSLLQITKNETA